MNTLDLIVLAIIVLCVYAGYRRGLILTLYRLVSFFLSIFLTSRLYPYMSRYLSQTALYDSIKDMAVSSLGLRAFFDDHTTRQAGELIRELPLPAALRDLLLAQQGPNVYELLRVNTVEDYIGGFFANMAINIIAMAAVFLLVWLLLGLLGGVLDIISHLPIINTLNRLGGLALGFVLGVIVVWIGLTLMGFLIATPANPQVYKLLQESLVASWLFDNNWMLRAATKS